MVRRPVQSGPHSGVWLTISFETVLQESYGPYAYHHYSEGTPLLRLCIRTGAMRVKFSETASDYSAHTRNGSPSQQSPVETPTEYRCGIALLDRTVRCLATRYKAKHS